MLPGIRLESGVLDMRRSTLERYTHAVGRELVLRLGTGAGSDRD